MQIPGMPEKFEDLCEVIINLGFIKENVTKTAELLGISAEDHGFTHRWDDPDQELCSTDRWFNHVEQLGIEYTGDVIAMLVDWSIMTGRMDAYTHAEDYKQHCRNWLASKICVALELDDEGVTETTLHPPVYRYLQGGKIFVINAATSGNGGGVNYYTMSLEEFVTYGQKVHS